MLLASAWQVTALGSTLLPALGSLQVIAVPVEFTDVFHTADLGNLNLTAASVESYYSAASFGQATLHITILSSWIALPHPMAYYGADRNIGDDAAGNQAGSQQLLIDSVSRAAARTDLSRYAYLIVVHAGADQSTSSPTQKSDLIWSRTWLGATYLPRGTDGGSIVSESSPLGIWAHELGHQLGHLPDLYDLASPDLHYMGTWSLMDIGPFLGTPTGSQPALFDAWSRISLGWIRPTLARSGDYNLIPAEVPPGKAAVSCCYALEVPIGNNSYYLVELRLKQGLDAAQRTGGVIVYLYNSTGLAEPQVVDPRHPTPARSDLSDAAIPPLGAFVDGAHQFSLTVVSGSSSYYSVHIDSNANFAVSLLLPTQVEVLKSANVTAVVNPPLSGLNLRVFLDGSQSPIGNLSTTPSSLYNFTLYLQGSQQGAHNLMAVLSDPAGKVLASTSVSFVAQSSASESQSVLLYSSLIVGSGVVVAVALLRSRRRQPSSAEPATETSAGS